MATEPREYVEGSSSLVLGVDSYTKPDELGAMELVMAMNCQVRGGIVQTRPGSRTLFCPPRGNMQGMTLFTPANGISQLVFTVDGKVYVSSYPFTEYRRLWNLQFSNTAKYMAWAVCLKSTDYDAAGNLITLDNPYSVLVMQDGLTRAAYWDGTTAAHLNPSPAPDHTDIPTPGYQETPIGLWMIWSGNRLWVSRGNKIYASDLGNPLKFTEAQYLNEARAFFLSGDCTGMIDVPADANTAKGFIAFTETNGTLFQSYIQDRTQWLTTPLFQNTIIPTVGCVAPRSLVTQYGLSWWFGPRGLTNINSALRQNITSRFDYQDNEMFASKAYLSPDLSGVCGAFYENYLLMSVPSQDVYNRHTWVLDQAPFENNAAAWAGYWSGWRPIEWARGIVNGAERLFFASVDYDGLNRIWEAMLPDKTDNGCAITCYAQLRDHPGGNLDLKQYRWTKFFLGQIYGDVNMDVYVASTKGSYQKLHSYHIVASEGQVFSDVEYSELGPYLIGNMSQSRIIRTPANPVDNECNKCGVESQVGNMIDYAFSHLLVWSGQMGIKAYQIHMKEAPDRDAGDCYAPEVGPRTLNALGCSGTELLVDGQFFDVFTARADGSVQTGQGQSVYLNFVGFSIISADDAQRNAQQRVDSVAATLAGQSIAPGNYNNPVVGGATNQGGGGGQLPWPDGGAGITPDTDGGGVLPPDGGAGDGGGGAVVDDDPGPTPEAPTIIQDPLDSTINEGEDTSFSVAAEGTMPLVYAWHFSADGGATWNDLTNGGIYSGVSTQHLVLTAATTTESGYKYRCRVTNEYGARTSAVATLTVNAAVTYLTLPPPIGSPPYADLAAAQAIIAGQTNNCIGFVDAASYESFSAVDGGTDLTIQLGASIATSGVPIYGWSGLNCAAGDVISVAYSSVGGFAAALGVDIYDSSGALVQSIDSGMSASPLVFNPLPSSGEYKIRFAASALLMPAEVLTATFILTTSGVLDISVIRAAYGGTPDYASCP